jgi:nitric oxide reductase activation protein
MVMDEAKLENTLRELAKEFGMMADPLYQKLATLAQEAQENHEKIRKSVDTLQESLEYLRVCIKYQSFDLEATRRENRYLKRLLEEQEL